MTPARAHWKVASRFKTTRHWTSWMSGMSIIIIRIVLVILQRQATLCICWPKLNRWRSWLIDKLEIDLSPAAPHDLVKRLCTTDIGPLWQPEHEPLMDVCVRALTSATKDRRGVSRQKWPYSRESKSVVGRRESGISTRWNLALLIGITEIHRSDCIRGQQK